MGDCNRSEDSRSARPRVEKHAMRRARQRIRLFERDRFDAVEGRRGGAISRPKSRYNAQTATSPVRLLRP
jgi:hypothetical protein